MTKENINIYIGVDVSKENLDAFHPAKQQERQFSNSKMGYGKLARWLLSSKEEVLVVCEATGDYHVEMARALQKCGIKVAVINPRQVRDFAKAKGLLSKTDKLDAVVLAEYGVCFKPKAMKEISDNACRLSHYQSRLGQLTKMIGAERARLSHAKDEMMIRAIKESILFLQQQLHTVEKLAQKVIKADPELEEKEALLKSMPGIGIKSARQLLVSLPELGQLGSKEISKLVGVAPLNRDSGKMRGTRSIWGGRANIRCGLYLPTLTATRYNNVIKGFYQQLRARGKSHKQAMIACMHKLLIILNSMVKYNELWQTSLT